MMFFWFVFVAAKTAQKWAGRAVPVKKQNPCQPPGAAALLLLRGYLTAAEEAPGVSRVATFRQQQLL